MSTFGNRALGMWSACSVLQALLPLQLDTLFTGLFCLTWQLLLLTVVEQRKGWGRSCSSLERAWLYFHRYFYDTAKTLAVFLKQKELCAMFQCRDHGDFVVKVCPTGHALGFCSVKSRCQLMEKRNAAKQLPVLVRDVCGGLFLVSVGLFFF